MTAHLKRITVAAAGTAHAIGPSEVAGQADIEMVPVATLMLSPSFGQGVEEYRARTRPNFEKDDWEYERGRQFAAIAPRDLPITSPNGRLNRKALAIFVRDIL
jgi:hypothetical protein